MTILRNGNVWLEKSESVPCWCPCGKVYQPPLNSNVSHCPKCSRQNIHEPAVAHVRMDD